MSEVNEQNEKTAAEAANNQEEKVKIPYELVESKKLNQSEMEYKIRISEAEFKKKENEIYDTIKKNVVIDGFRKGKAPIGLLRSRFKEDVYKQMLEDFCENIAPQITEAAGIVRVNDGAVTDYKMNDVEEYGVKVVKSLDMTIVVEIEPKLEIDEKILQAIPVKVQKIEINDSKVDDELNRLQEQNATFESKGEGAIVEENDAIITDIEIINESGDIIPNMSHADMMIKNIKEQLPEPVVKAVIGKKIGEKVEVENNMERVNAQGAVISKKDKWILNIKDIKKKALPTIDDEFAKDLGEFANIQALKDKIKEEIVKGKETAEREMIVAGIEKYFLQNIEVEPPKTIVNEEFISTYRRKMELYKKVGVSKQEIKEYEENLYLEDFFHTRLKVMLDLIYQEIIKMRTIEASEEDITAEIEKLAARQGRKPLAIRAQLEAKNGFDELKKNIAKNKLVDALVKEAKVEYVDEEGYKADREEMRQLLRSKVMKVEENQPEEETPEAK